MVKEREYLKDIVNNMLQSRIVVLRMYIYYILFEHVAQLINQWPRKSCHLSRKTCEGKKRNTKSISTSVMMTQAVSSHESSCFAS